MSAAADLIGLTGWLSINVRSTMAGVLATLLPGVRHIRTPLAIGYAWLLVLWFSVGHLLPDPGQATGVLADAYRLAAVLGPLGSAAVVSVGAYMLGVVAEPASETLMGLVGYLLRLTPAGPLTAGYRRDKNVRTALKTAIAERLANRFTTDERFRNQVVNAFEARPKHPDDILPDDITDEAMTSGSFRFQIIWDVVDFEPLVDEIKTDLYYIAERSRTSDEYLYNEYDRGHAEADFRLAMYWPIAALLTVLAVRWSPFWWAAVAAVSYLLPTVGVLARTKVERKLVWAIAAGKITDPLIDQLDVTRVEMLYGTSQTEDKHELTAASGTAQ